MSPLPSEDVLVTALAGLFGSRRRDILAGIGDDAAWIRTPDSLLLATDVLVEGSDFLPGTDPRRLGRKALSVNLSDLAAMGGIPLHALLTLGLPPTTDQAWVEALAGGFREVAREHGVVVIGGDLSASAVPFVSAVVTGHPASEAAIRRRGARPGDAIYLSGTLGAAAGGFALLSAGFRLGDDGDARGPSGRKVPGSRAGEIQRLIRHQLDPRPMVDLGRALAELRAVSAAIDVSDGFAKDLHRLCRASGVGASVDVASLPVDSALHDLPPGVRVDPLALALYGGEDYSLLFTVPREKRSALERLSGRFALRCVGVVARGERVEARSGDRVAILPDSGFDHFAPRGVKRRTAKPKAPARRKPS